MKTKLLALGTLVLAVLCAWQWRELRLTRARLAEASQALQTEQQERETQAERARALGEQQSRLSEQVADLSSFLAAARAAGTKPADTPAGTPKPSIPAGAASGLFGKGMSGMLSKMMKDPAMKDMIRSQQKMVMGMMYGSIAKDLNLTPEQDEKLKELLLDQQMQTLDGAQSLFTKGGDTNAGAFANSLGEKQKQSDESIKALLGDEKFAQYGEYKKTMGERMQLNMFKQQMEGAQNPLQDEQIKQLMGVIQDEKEKSPPDLSEELKTDPSNFAKLLSGDLMEKQMQRQEEINRRVLDRAGQILTPDQLKAYADFQSQQLNMQKISMKMARDMFDSKDGPDDPKAPAAPEK